LFYVAIAQTIVKSPIKIFAKVVTGSTTKKIWDAIFAEKMKKEEEPAKFAK
jgi:hypothetical protein